RPRPVDARVDERRARRPERGGRAERPPPRALAGQQEERPERGREQQEPDQAVLREHVELERVRPCRRLARPALLQVPRPAAAAASRSRTRSVRGPGSTTRSTTA